MEPVRSALQLDDRSAVDHAIQHGHGQLRVAEVLGPLFEVDVGNQSRGAFLAAGVDDLVPQTRRLRREAAFHAIEAKFVHNEERKPRVEADAVVDGLIGERGREIFEEFAAGDVVDGVFEQTRGQTDALDEPAFSEARLPDENDVLFAANEVTLGEGFDLHARDGGVEGPVEGGERPGFAEAGVLDEPFDAALASQAGLIGEQSMEEVEVGEAGVLGVLQRRVELVGGHGDAKRGEVGEDLVTPVRGRGRRRFRRFRFRGFLAGLHRGVPRVGTVRIRAGVDNRWWAAGR